MSGDIDKVACWCTGISNLFSYPESELPDLTLLTSDLPGWFPAPKATLEKLQTEYTRLFINSLPEVPCPPYGSIYLEGSCMASSTIAVRNLYRELGSDPTEMPDHIAVEMEFLGILLPRIAENPEILYRTAAELIQHLADWTKEFFRLVEKHDQTGYYARGATLGRTVVECLVDLLSTTPITK